jgi:DNA mismatch repair protein MutL
MAKAFMPEAIKGEQLTIKEAAPVKTESAPASQVKNDVIKIVEENKSEERPVARVEKAPAATTLTFNSREAQTLDFLKDEYVNKSEKKFNLSININSAKAEEKQEPVKACEKDNVNEAEKQEEIITEKPSETIEPEKEVEAEAACNTPDFRIVGEAFKTYIFVELENKLLMIDKHAAHERILFEKFKAQQKSYQQMLLIPVTVSLSPDEYNAILENEELLYKAGYEVSDFGDRCVKVSACPTELINEDIAAIITEIASYLSSNAKTVMPEKLDWIYHSMACRAAIKAGNTTTEYEMEKFVENLLSREDIRYCPHGRPVMVEVTKRELEKQFKRII